MVKNALQLGIEEWAAQQCLEPEKVIYLDTETNGLKANLHHILEFGVINGKGETLLEHLVKPQRFSRSMDLRTDIHGLTYEDLENAQSFPEIFPKLLGILQSAKTILVYNKTYDSSMLAGMVQRYGLRLPKLPWGKCVMEQYATYYHGYQGGRWQRLGDACTQLKIKALPGLTAHRAIADCQSTRQIVEAMATRYHARVVGITTMEKEISSISEDEA